MVRTLITALVAAVAVLVCVKVWSGSTKSLQAETPAFDVPADADFAAEVAEPVPSAEGTSPFVPIFEGRRVLSEYQELMRRRSERMSDEELQQEVDRLRTELTEQDAQAEQALSELIQALQKFLVDYRGTAASAKAAAALQAMQRTQDAGKSNSPTPFRGFVR